MRVARANVWLAALLLITGCTGTQEATLPTLLAVAFEGETGPQLALVEDVFDPFEPVAERLRLVPGSELQLPDPAVALDVTDRAGDRGELVLLLRSPQGMSNVVFVQLAGVDPRQPEAFRIDRQVEVGAIIAAATDAPAPCLSEVQVTTDGNIGAFLENGVTECGSDGVPRLHLVDLEQERYLADAMAEIETVGPLLPAGIYIDQRTDLIYFAVGGIDRTLIYAFELPDGNEPVQVGAVSSPDDVDVVDLARVADSMVVLGSRVFGAVPLAGDGEDGAGVSTISNASSLASDLSGGIESFLVLSPSEVALHASPQDGEPRRASLSTPPRGATVEPIQRFAYLVQEGAITVVDLLPSPDGAAGGNLGTGRHSLDWLTSPQVVTWFYSTGAPALP